MPGWPLCQSGILRIPHNHHIMCLISMVLGAKGRDYWLMTRDGRERSGADYVLDPGHPDVVEYTLANM